MKLFRVATRFAAFACASAFFYLFFVAGKAVLLLFPRRRLWWRKIILNSWARTLALIIRMKVEVSGQPPRPPFFLVSNHLSYVDIIAYASLLDCVFVSRADIADWPGIGLLARVVGTIFINRQSIHDIPRVIGLVNQKLDDGLGVILFPEGTSTIGEGVLPFKPSLLEPAARATYPVSYASISYRTPASERPASDIVCWWGDADFIPHLIDLLKVPRFEAFIMFGDHAIQADDRKVLARNLWQAVNNQFIPMVDSTVLDHDNRYDK